MKQEKPSMEICDKCAIPKHVKNVLACETFGGELKPAESACLIVGCLEFKEKHTVHLNLIKHWFNYILNGVKLGNAHDYKRHEYREITPYFCEKFLLSDGEKKPRKFWTDTFEFCVVGGKIKGEMKPLSLYLLMSLIDIGRVTFINPDTFTFSNGMTPPVPRFEIECKGIEINTGRKRWGAVPDKKYFVLKLGKIINRENC